MHASSALTYVKSNELARRLGFETRSGLRRWARQHGVIGVRRGKALFYDLRDVQDVMERNVRPARRRARGTESATGLGGGRAVLSNALSRDLGELGQKGGKRHSAQT